MSDTGVEGEVADTSSPDEVDTSAEPDVNDVDAEVDSGEGCPAGTTDCGGECVDLESDPGNCNWCGYECPLLYEHMVALCVDSVCSYECAAGWADRDGAAGCEAECSAAGTDPCNYVDDDCDGVVDNGFDLELDASNCGACGRGCVVDHTTTSCVAAVCTVTDCNDGWFDADGNPYNGCEYGCVATAVAESAGDGTCEGGTDEDCDDRIDGEDADCAACVPEQCNGMDDDCDTLTDEGFDLRTDLLNCGACGHACGYRPHATPGCVLGVCDFGCDPGWADVDGDLPNGCEAICVPGPGGGETYCNGQDNDCDGEVDEDYVPYGCGVGACEADSVCTRASETCLPLDPLATVDALCDGMDNDCDGDVDEDYAPTYTCGSGACERDSRCLVGEETCIPGC